MRKLLFATCTMVLPATGFGVLTVQFTVWNETCGNANGAIHIEDRHIACLALIDAKLSHANLLLSCFLC